MLEQIQKRFSFLSPVTSVYLGFSIVYLVLHLLNLTALPVFADEAIYIRWAQLIIDDPQRFAFYPLNDGKTPLFIWLMTLFQPLFANQLYAARFVSVWSGLAQLWVLLAISRQISKRILFTVMMGIAGCLLPVWFFYHRMALMDGLLTLLLSLSFLIGMQYSQQFSAIRKYNWLVSTIRSGLQWKNLKYILVIGSVFGLALLTKIPAILFAPSLLLVGFLNAKHTWKQQLQVSAHVLGAIGVGLLLFLSLKLQPAFSQLFSRGGDFLHPVSFILLEGGWMQSLAQLPRYFQYMVGNITFPLVLLSFLPLFVHKYRRVGFVLLLSGLSFMAPMWLMGKVVYPRYFMPGMAFVSMAGLLGLLAAIEQWVEQPKQLARKTVGAIFVSMTVAALVQASVAFAGYSLFFPNKTPFVEDDRVQYLTEWSSGHGIREVVERVELQSTQGNVALATEGFFGTLPDGIQIYLHGEDHQNIYVEGIGQPVASIPDFFWERSTGYDTVWLVVNSHRMDIELEPKLLIAEYCRPYLAPCLQLWDISGLRPE